MVAISVGLQPVSSGSARPPNTVGQSMIQHGVQAEGHGDLAALRGPPSFLRVKNADYPQESAGDHLPKDRPVPIPSLANPDPSTYTGNRKTGQIPTEPVIPAPEFPRSFPTADLSDAEVEEIASARMDPRHDHLNALMDE